MDGFQTEGYLGGSFEGSFDSMNFGKIESINFEVTLENEKTEVVRTIDLFRPDIRIEHVPDEILIDYKKNKKTGYEKFTLSDRIALTNLGEGTALISIVGSEDSELELTLPNDMLEAMSNLIDDMENAIKTLSERYPSYSSTISEFLEMIKVPIPTIETAERYKNARSKLDNYMDTDETFKDDFIETFIGAILKNYSMSKELNSFLGYLISMKPHKVILMDPFIRIKVPKGKSYLSISIRITDLSRNPYDAIMLQRIPIISEKELELPFSEIIDFDGGEKSSDTY